MLWPFLMEIAFLLFSVLPESAIGGLPWCRPPERVYRQICALREERKLRVVFVIY